MREQAVRALPRAAVQVFDVLWMPKAFCTTSVEFVQKMRAEPSLVMALVMYDDMMTS